MARHLFVSPPPHKKPPPPPRPPPPPNNHPHIFLTYFLINISCLPANFDSSFNQVNSMLTRNSVQKFNSQSPTQYITNYQKPESDIEKLYKCLNNSNISLSNISIIQNEHREIYDPAFYYSSYYDDSLIYFSVNNTYNLSSNVIIIRRSGEGLTIAISFTITISGMCFCACLCGTICSNSNRDIIYPR